MKKYIPVIIIIILVALFVFFLPDISDYLSTKRIFSENNEKSSLKSKDYSSDYDENTLYLVTGDLELQNNELTFKNFIYENDILSFNIINNSGTQINIDEKNIFIELYTEEEKLIKRLKLTNKVINGMDTTYEINCPNVSKILLNQKSIKTYPEIIFTSEDNKQIICEKNGLTYTYYFDEQDKLYQVDKRNVVTKFDMNYENEKLNIKSNIDKIALYEGVTVTQEENEREYVALYRFDYKKLNNDILDIYAYKKDTLAKVVYFEMESLEFYCTK